LCSEGYCSGGSTCTQSSPTSCSIDTGCGGHAGCFLAGSLVETTAGLIAIELLSDGDEVVSYDPESDTVTTEKVVRTYKTVQCGYYLINGTMKVTAYHPFRVGDEWIEAGDLVVGDILATSGGHTAVTSIQKVDRGVRVYNIEVSGAHTFFVDDVLVHNKGPIPQG
jgi:intein/homing endonuclease